MGYLVPPCTVYTGRDLHPGSCVGMKSPLSGAVVMVEDGLLECRGPCDDPKPSQEGRAGLCTVGLWTQWVLLAALPW